MDVLSGAPRIRNTYFASTLAARKEDGFVRADVTDDRDYACKCATGLALAKLWLEGVVAGPVPSLGQLQEAHHTAYEAVYPNAGQVRRPGQQIVFSGQMGADPQRVAIEYARLQAEMDEMLAEAKTPTQKAVAVAFFHSRLNAIRPFRDGNERLARVVLSHQCNELFGPGAGAKVIKALGEDRGAYHEANKVALGQNDLTPLAGIVCRGLGVTAPAKALPSPFQVRSLVMRSLDDVGPLESDRARAQQDVSVAHIMQAADAPDEEIAVA